MPDTSASGNGFGSRPEAINRRGRAASAVTGIRALVLQTMRQRHAGGKKTKAQALIDRLLELAFSGNMEAAKLLLQYGWGRPGVAVELAGPGGEPLQLSSMSVSEFAAKMAQDAGLKPELRP